MLIDLHTHTRPCSPCAVQTADELIRAAHGGRVGCSLCHRPSLCVRRPRGAGAGAREFGLTVFRGVEARTTLGDILVFGLDEDIADGTDGTDLLRYVDERGGASVLAHPFRRGGGLALW